MGYKRSLTDKKRNKELAKITSYPSGAYYTGDIVYGITKNPYYKRYWRGNHKNSRFAYYKKHFNRVVRRYAGTLTTGGIYKKCFDYWRIVI